MKETLECPERFDMWTPDEVAECVDGVSNVAYRELWGVLSNPRFKTRPLGGDGSHGTVEAPVVGYSGSLARAWQFLSDDAKQSIIEAAAKRPTY